MAKCEKHGIRYFHEYGEKCPKCEALSGTLNRLVGFILSAGTLLIGGFLIKSLLYQKGLFLPLSGLWCVATSIWVAIKIRE